MADGAAPALELNATILAAVGDTRFADSVAVDNFFQQRKGQHYIRWFNSTLANQGPWAGVTLVDTPANDLGFHQFWNQIPHVFGGDIGVVQFVCLMSIISNEQRGDFAPRTEKMGIAGHPGMAYLFDRIGKKRSYNTLAGNQTARQCFDNDAFLAVHGTLPLADRAARSTDDRWSGEVWPADFPTDPSPAVSGFVTQADFMKFRGRGFIQTTGRANYRPLIDFVQAYDGENSTVDFYQHRWTGKQPDQIAFETSNADWDNLFQKTDLLVATEAIRVHNQNSGGYLALSADPDTLNGTGAGSIYFMGLRISGGADYASTFKQRVIAVLSALNQD